MNKHTTFFLFFLVLFSITTVSALNFDNDVLNFGEDDAKNVSDFLDLTDTPTTYAGSGTDCVRVNAGATGLEFSSCLAGGGISWANAVNGTLLQNNTDLGWEINFTTIYVDNILSDDWSNVTIISSQVSNFNLSLDTYNTSLKNWIDGQVFVKNDSADGWELQVLGIGVNNVPPADPGIIIGNAITGVSSSYNGITATPTYTPNAAGGNIRGYSSGISVAGTQNVNEVSGMFGLAVVTGLTYSGQADKVMGASVQVQGILSVDINDSIGLYISTILGGKRNWSILDESGQPSNFSANMFITDANVTADFFKGDGSELINLPGILWSNAVNGTLTQNFSIGNFLNFTLIYSNDWSNVTLASSSQVLNFNNSLDTYNTSISTWTDDNFVNVAGDNMTGNLTFEVGSGVFVFNGTVYLTNNYNICWKNGTGTCQGYIIRNNSGMYLRG